MLWPYSDTQGRSSRGAAELLHSAGRSFLRKPMRRQLRTRLHGAVKRLEDLKFIVESENDTWKVRKLLNARLMALLAVFRDE
jgi:hypothetical protein